MSSATNWLAGWLRRLTLATIVFYQRFISPHKGFRCAYRFHTGRASCSTLGLRAVRRHGAWRGIGILRVRLAQCGLKHRKYSPRRPHFRSQAGFCDADCGGCDGFDLDTRGPACQIVQCCDLPGDCGNSKKKEPTRERAVAAPTSSPPLPDNR